MGSALGELLQGELDQWVSVAGDVLGPGRSLTGVVELLSALARQPSLVSTVSRVAPPEEATSANEPPELEPDRLGAWMGLARLLDEYGEHQRAEEACHRALRLQPRRAHVWLQLGDIRSARGDYEGALLAYEQGLRWQPLDPRLAFHRARAQGALGRRDEARQSTPGAVQRELGELREVSRVVHGQALACRYWAADDVAPLFEALAHSLLEGALAFTSGDLALGSGACVDHGSSPLRVVAHRDRLLLCDADCSRELRPDRFLECNEAISLLYAQHLCLSSAGLEPQPCRWTDLVQIELPALSQTRLQMRRTEPLAGESGWVIVGADDPAFARRASEAALDRVPVYELRRRRPSLTRFLTLPTGAELELQGTQLRELRFGSASADPGFPPQLLH